MKERIINGLELIFIFVCVVLTLASVEKVSNDNDQIRSAPKTHNLA